MSNYSEKETRPLYVWPKGCDLAGLKAAVLDLDLPFRVAPYWFEPGKHDKCIALSDGFDWVVDHVYPKSPAALQASVEWFFGMRDLPQAKTVLSKMESVFGDGTQEVWDWPSSE